MDFSSSFTNLVFISIPKNPNHKAKATKHDKCLKILSHMALFMRCLTALPRFQILFLLEFKTTRPKLTNTISAYKFCLIWLSLCTTSPTPSSLLLKLLYAPSLSLSLSQWPKQMQQSIRRKLTIVICHWFTQIALPLTLTIPYQE